HACHFRGEDAELGNHLVDQLGGAEELPFEALPVALQAHGLCQVTFRHSADRAAHFESGPDQVADERVDRMFHALPGAVPFTNAAPVAVWSFLTDGPAEAFELLGHAFVSAHDIV